MKAEEQRKARELRALGWSIGEIERAVGVSRSSISGWVRNMELTPEAQKRLLQRAGLGPTNSARRSSERARGVRLGYQDEGRHLVRVRGMSYAAGCMLYWAEGDKCRNAVRIANSDPEVLVVFVEFLRRHFEVGPEKVTIACNLFT